MPCLSKTYYLDCDVYFALSCIFRQMPALVGHYTWLGFVLLNMPIGRAVMFLLSAQMLCGLLQAWIIGLGHNGMASYNAETRPDFWKLQVSA